MRYVQDALPGNEAAGYAESLVGVHGEWRGSNVEAMPRERDNIEDDPTTATPEMNSLIETDDA